MTEPTLDGLTREQFVDLIVAQAMIRAKAQFATEGMPWDERVEPSIEFGAEVGVVACYAELSARGLVLERS